MVKKLFVWWGITELVRNALFSKGGTNGAKVASDGRNVRKNFFRSARTSCRTYDFPVPSTCPPVRNNFSWVHIWAVTLPSGLRYPSNRIFYESWWCQLSNSDENTNTKTNTDTNTNTGTNKGKTNDSYDVIYCLKGDDKRILNMICYRQRL